VRSAPVSVVLCTVGAGIVVPLFVLAGRSPAEATRRSDAPLLRVDSTLPAWLAPGATGRVRGYAGANERLFLRDGRRTLARVQSGPLGRFVLRFRAPEPGRYRLSILASGRTTPAGVLRVRPLVLEAVGDVTFGEQVGPAVAAYGGGYPWMGVAETLRAANLTVANLETSISTQGVAAAKKYTFRGPPRALPAMARIAGFDVLTLANNHTNDYGPEALLDTIRYVRAAGMKTIGAGANERLAGRAALVEAGGLRIAFLGFSDINPAGFSATTTTPGTARADPEAIARAVGAARTHADLVVCFMHWGVELHGEPDSRQAQLASACLRAGAQVVLGAHPHVLGPVQRPTARTLVAWTLGNFVFPSSGVTARTAVLQVRIDARGVRGYQLLPVEIDGFRPRLLCQRCARAR
jgi:poly-gamma-glutamate capsule biosynthesis protein CapA/YwtB (metallophosphatase superfamily)